MQAPPPFEELEAGKYSVVYADPPWPFKCWSGKGTDRAADNHYQTMSIDDIMTLPVGSLAAEDCALIMWVCWPTLPEALRVIESWGFSYKTCGFCWLKADVSTINMWDDEVDVQIGTGYYTRANSEVALLATRGSPKRLNADVRQGVIAPRREHSRKPSLHDRIDRLFGGHKVELFARQKRPGWDVWGLQTDRFKPVEEPTESTLDK